MSRAGALSPLRGNQGAAAEGPQIAAQHRRQPGALGIIEIKPLLHRDVDIDLLRVAGAGVGDGA